MIATSMINLSREVRDFGWKLLEKIQQEKDFPITGLFWGEFTEGSWRLFLATPLAATIGTIAVYGRLEEMLKSILPEYCEEVDLADIVVTNPKQMRVRQAIAWAKGRYGSAEVPADRNVVRRAYLESYEFYIYTLSA